MTATVTQTGTANTWDLSVTVGSTPYTGTCTHDTSVSAQNLTCTFNVGFPVTFVGDLNGNAWSGTWSDPVPETGTFSLTRS